MRLMWDLRQKTSYSHYQVYNYSITIIVITVVGYSHQQILVIYTKIRESIVTTKNVDVNSLETSFIF